MFAQPSISQVRSIERLQSRKPRLRPNRRLQLTAFGARDRGFFEIILCRAPRRQLKRSTLDGSFSHQ